MDPRPAQLRTGDVDCDAFCACGYNLRGLQRKVLCPECGARTDVVAGRYLWDCDPAWLEQVRAGVIRMIFAHFAYVPVLVVVSCLARGCSRFGGIPWIAPVMLQALAVQFLFKPEPGVRRSTRDDRLATFAVSAVNVWLVLHVVYCGVYTMARLAGRWPSIAEPSLNLVDAASTLAWLIWTALTSRLLCLWSCRLRMAWLVHVVRLTWLALAAHGVWTRFPVVMYVQFGVGINDPFPDWLGSIAVTSVYSAFGLLLFFWIALNLAIEGVNLSLHRARGTTAHEIRVPDHVPWVPRMLLAR